MSCKCTVSVEFGTATLSSHTKVSIKLPCPMATPCSAQRIMPLPCITICATPTVSKPLVPGFTNALLETVPCSYATVELVGQGGSSRAAAGGGGGGGGGGAAGGAGGGGGGGG